MCECGTPCVLSEQAAWTPEQVDAYRATPIPYEVCEVDPMDIGLGLDASHARWVWKPYECRNEEHRADFDRLLVSIYHHGIKTPLIGWKHPETGIVHALVGQRRAEIAKRLGMRSVPVAIICEDVRRYWQHDLARIKMHLKTAVGEWGY